MAGQKGKWTVRQLLARAKRREARREKALAAERRKARKPVITAKEAAAIEKRERALAEARKLRRRREAQLAEQRSIGQKALEVAKGLLDVREVGGNNVGPMVTKIIRANAGVGPEPWCGDFLAYIFRAVGCRSVNRSWAAVIFLRRIVGAKVHPRHVQPKPGWIVVYNFDGGVEDHCGIVEKSPGSGIILAIEGNTTGSSSASDSGGGEGVHRRRRPTTQVAHYVEVTR